MKKIDVHQVDSFTDKIFGGNPAGVVTNADGLSDDTMKSIAREMNLSETAFVLTATVPDADVKLRFFTKTADEIDFCGHATVGALYELARLKMYNLGNNDNTVIRVETNVSVLNMSVDSRYQKIKVTFVAPQVAMKPFRLQGADFEKAFSIPSGSVMLGGDILIDETLNYVYIPTTSLDILGALRFDFSAIREQFQKDAIVVFCLFASQAFSETSDLRARGLAPLVGIDEDPFTGSMQAGMVYAAKQLGMLAENQEKVVVEQGNYVDRPGFATIHHTLKNNEISVTANVAHVFSTVMEVE
jgi:trans-2,3-dihydro-3-hydroxyanthranilate isomerase